MVRVPTNHLIEKGPFEGTRASLQEYEIPNGFVMQNLVYGRIGAAICCGIRRLVRPQYVPAWKAEKFDPDYLLGLYKKAGAKYFMSMGVHHDMQKLILKEMRKG